MADSTPAPTATPSPSPDLGARFDRVRRANLATVLALVHVDGPASRSALTQATGLNRSTIAALVGELVELGLVVESDPVGSNKVGRPSPVVTPSARVVALTVNPEIDAVTVGVVGLDGAVQHRVRRDTVDVPTASDAARVAAAVIADLRAGALASDVRVVGVGVAVPGLVDAAGGVVRLAPHLGWVDEPFAAVLASATGLPTEAANDASLGAIAEGRFGAGRGVDDLVFLNGGASGVGGGVLLGGRPMTGVGGYAGEIGHTLVNSAGRVCHCGAVGCLETEVGQARLLAVTGLDRGQADRLDAALAGAEPGSPVAVEVRRQIDFLSVALRGVVNAFNPELIVLGGFLGSLHAADPDRLAERVRSQSLPGARDGVRLVRAALGADRLTIGAAELAFASVLADPASAARAS
jgi:predicted NBD/HSP70 family sugar kinase